MSYDNGRGYDWASSLCEGDKAALDQTYIEDAEIRLLTEEILNSERDYVGPQNTRV